MASEAFLGIAAGIRDALERNDQHKLQLYKLALQKRQLDEQEEQAAWERKYRSRQAKVLEMQEERLKRLAALQERIAPTQEQTALTRARTAEQEAQNVAMLRKAQIAQGLGTAAQAVTAPLAAIAKGFTPAGILEAAGRLPAPAAGVQTLNRELALIDEMAKTGQMSPQEARTAKLRIIGAAEPTQTGERFSTLESALATQMIERGATPEQIESALQRMRGQRTPSSFQAAIVGLQSQLNRTTDPEERKRIQEQIREYQRLEAESEGRLGAAAGESLLDIRRRQEIEEAIRSRANSAAGQIYAIGETNDWKNAEQLLRVFSAELENPPSGISRQDWGERLLQGIEAWNAAGVPELGINPRRKTFAESQPEIYAQLLELINPESAAAAEAPKPSAGKRGLTEEKAVQAVLDALALLQQTRQEREERLAPARERQARRREMRKGIIRSQYPMGRIPLRD